MPQHLTAKINEKEQNSDGVNLLISMLVRYPEIGAISFEPDTNSLKLTFIISGSLPAEDYEAAKWLINGSIASFHMLSQTNNENFIKDRVLVEIDISSYAEAATLTVIRDVPTISCGEITLIIGILNEQFTGCLAGDLSDQMLKEDILLQDEAIESMLKNIRKQNVLNKSLIGIREEGRVFVFNK